MRVKIAILFLAVVLSIPSFALGWGAKGQLEPDTAADRGSGWMWPAGSTDTTSGTQGHRVYFNAFTSQSIGAHAEVGSSLNPNFATVGSERQSWNGRQAAMLGVWKDCNNDGYVGLGDNGLFEYRSELLAATFGNSICPPTTPAAIPTNAAATHNYEGVHNDGVWVREFFPIGPDGQCLTASATPGSTCTLKDLNVFDLNDNGARVWVDWGAPGSIPSPTRCYAFAPEGSYHSTGGLLQYVDCYDGFAATTEYDAIIAAIGGDSLGLGQLSFKDHPYEQFKSASILNQKNPYGTSDQGSDAYVWDCNSPALVAHFQPIASNNKYQFQVSAPRSNPNLNAGGSPASTVNETLTGADDCNRANNNGQWEGDIENTPYSNENQGIAITTPDGKQQTDFVMAYQEGQRNPAVNPAIPTSATGVAIAKDAGVRATETEGFYLSTTIVGEDRNPYVGRGATPGPSPVQYITAYAVVSGAAITKYSLVLPKGTATGIYGAENCSTFTTGTHNGWKCAASQWWPGGCTPGNGYSCTGTVDGQVVDISESVGAVYNLRDVDCYDTSVSALRAQGVSYGVLAHSADSSQAAVCS